MNYDIYFLKREPGQAWEDAMEALEEQSAAAADVLTRPPGWDQVVAGVRCILGDVSVVENPPGWEIDHERTGIQVSCYSREWAITVPYWSDGAVAVTGHLRAIAGIVQTATGLAAYDPQVDMAVTTDDWTAQQAASVFDQVAEAFDPRGSRRG